MSDKKIVRATKPGHPIDPKNEVFYINDETMTIGQPLAHMLLAHPDVKLAGVNKVHPADNYLVLKVEINPNSDTTAIEVLKQVLTNLYNQYDHILTTFQAAVKEYEAKQENNMDLS